jgi:hypothetical protein
VLSPLVRRISLISPTFWQMTLQIWLDSSEVGTRIKDSELHPPPNVCKLLTVVPTKIS